MQPIAILVLSILVGLFQFGCNKPNPEAKGKGIPKRNRLRKKEEEIAIPVKVATAKWAPLSSYLEFDSILETESAVEIHPESSGLVVAVMAEVGDSGEVGQV